MPSKPRWWSKINEIELALVHFDRPVVDRACFEILFGVKRRQAQMMMNQMGGYQAGRTWLVDRKTLLRQLRSRKSSPEAHQDRGRRQKLASALAEARRMARAQAVTIEVEAPAVEVAGLPEGCRFQPGQLVITFHSTRQLLTRLYSLSQRIAADYENFARSVEQASPLVQTEARAGTQGGV